MALIGVPIYDPRSGVFMGMSAEANVLNCNLLTTNFMTITGNLAIGGAMVAGTIAALGAAVPQLRVGLDIANSITFSVTGAAATITYTGINNIERAGLHEFRSEDGLSLYAYMQMHLGVTPTLYATNARIDNIFSDVFVTDLRVADETITVNSGGTDASAVACGIEVEGTGAVPKGCIIMNAAKTGWIIRPFTGFAANDVTIIPTGNVTLTVSGNSVINQDVSTAGSPQFATVTTTGNILCGGFTRIIENIGALIMQRELDTAAVWAEFQTAVPAALSRIGHEDNLGAGLFGTGIANALCIGTIGAVPLCFVYNSVAVPVLQLGVTADFTVSGAVTINNEGGDVSFTVTNTDDDSGLSNALIDLICGGEGGNPGLGDPYIRFSVFGTTGICIGIDNSDSDTLKIDVGAGCTPSTGADLLTLTTTGILAIDNIAELTGAHNIVFNNPVLVDDITEATADHGVLISTGTVAIDMTAPHTLTAAEMQKAYVELTTAGGTALTFANGGTVAPTVGGIYWSQIYYNNTGGNITLTQGAAGHTLLRNEGSADLVLATTQCCTAHHFSTAANTYFTLVTISA